MGFRVQPDQVLDVMNVKDVCLILDIVDPPHGIRFDLVEVSNFAQNILELLFVEEAIQKI